MASGAKKKEEQNLKALRELTALPANKKCQECQERGTTYADMTTFGFVCTACSGYLRGINPPHRVKSISMTTFSEAEIEKLKKGGNDISRSIWLAKWNPKLDREPEKRTELAFKEFLISKYERRQWYVSPTEAKKEEKKEGPKPETKLQPPPKSPGRAGSLTKSSQAVATATSHQAGSLTTPQTTPQTTPSQPPPTSTTTTGGTRKVDLLGELTNDPFAPKQPPVGGVSVLPPIGSAPLLRPKSDDFGAFTGAAAPSGSQPHSAGTAPGLTSTQSLQSMASGSMGGDKYAALASLDDSLREVRVRDEQQLQQQQALQQQQQQQQQAAQQSRAQGYAPGGGFSGPVNPFGGPGGQVRPGPAQQVNPFAGGTSPNRMVGVPGGFGNQPPGGGGGGGGFGGFQGAGGFPGQARPSQPFGGLSQSPQQQQFGAFGGQQAGTVGPYNAQQQQQQQTQWGAQQNFGPGVGGVQGAQTQWRPPQQQQQPQQQWGQIQSAGFGGMPGQVPGSPGGPGFGGGGGGVGMQPSNPQMQFGGFVGAGPQMQQQPKPANQFNWGSGSSPVSQSQSRVMPASSGSFDAAGGSRKPSVQSSLGSSWGGSLTGQPQQQPQSLGGGAVSSSWSSVQSGGWSGGGAASFGQGGGGGGGGFNQPAPVAGGQNWGAFGQQQQQQPQQPGGFGAFGGQTQPQQFGNQPQQFGRPPQQFGNQPQQFGNQTQPQQLGGLQGGPAANPFASQSQPHTNPFL